MEKAKPSEHAKLILLLQLFSVSILPHIICSIWKNYLVFVIIVGSSLDINAIRKRKREDDDIVFNDENIDGEYDALSPNGPTRGYIDEKPKLTEVV